MTLNKSLFFRTPSICAALTILGSVVIIPLKVFVNIGKNEPRKIINTFEDSPRPSQIMASGIQARGGIGRSILIGVRSTLPSFPYHPERMPMVIPATAPSEKPMITRKRLIPMCSSRRVRGTFLIAASITLRGPGKTCGSRIPIIATICHSTMMLIKPSHDAQSVRLKPRWFIVLPLRGRLPRATLHVQAGPIQ